MAKSLVLNRSRKVPAEDTAAFGAIAERFRRAGALERAVELCREGLQKFPDHISARVTLGWSLLDLGKYDEARVELEQVLRRAPDNLAAIRGLAELHDRFEHTLHLPMDGPGQWPPAPESVDEAAGEAHASATDGDAGAGDLEMTPAALGIPIFSPAVSPSPEVEPPASPVAAAPPVVSASPAEVAPAAKATKAAKAPKTPKAAAPKAPPAVTEPALKAEPVAAPAVASTPAPEAARAVPPRAAVSAASVPAAPQVASEQIRTPTTASGSGMSSVREIDFASAPSSVAAEAARPQAETTEVAEDAYSVSDADIQALIAEADSLDAEAGMTPAESETVSLDAMVFNGEDALAAVAGVEPARAMSYSSVTEPISVDFDLDTPPGGMAISLAALGVVTAEPAVASPTDESGVDAATEAARAKEAAAQADRAKEEAAQAARAKAQPEVAPVAAIADVVSIDAGRTAAKSPMPALERFLSKVQARRKQLMAESVA